MLREWVRFFLRNGVPISRQEKNLTVKAIITSGLMKQCGLLAEDVLWAYGLDHPHEQLVPNG